MIITAMDVNTAGVTVRSRDTELLPEAHAGAWSDYEPLDTMVENLTDTDEESLALGLLASVLSFGGAGNVGAVVVQHHVVEDGVPVRTVEYELVPGE